jgi:hydroxyacylglutathione hydrolase
MNHPISNTKYGQEITRISLGFVNAFIIQGENQLILVDTGIPGNENKILHAIEELGFKPDQVSLIILTHAHFDHTGSLKELINATHAKVAIHVNDAPYLISGTSAAVKPLSAVARIMTSLVKMMPTRKAGSIQPDILIEDEMSLVEFEVKGRVISTPGHTSGSISIILDSGNCLVGDLLWSIFGKPIYSPIGDDPFRIHESAQKIIQTGAKQVYLSHGGVFPVERIRKMVGSFD